MREKTVITYLQEEGFRQQMHRQAHPGYSIRAEPSYFAYRIMIERRINHPLLHLHFFCQLQHLFFYLRIKNNAGF